jgi:putative ATP-binding cassette transporter
VTGDGGLKLVELRLDLPDGEPLLACSHASIEPGERVALVGPSGSGKTTLFRAIAGMWPFGRGTIVMPPSSKALFVPQRSYLPIGTLRAAAAYPAEETAFSDEKVREAFDLLGLGHLAERLDESAHWEQQLSGHEEQRLALVRALLHAPEWLFLDHATAALDDVMEKHVYEVLARQLPRTAVLSVTSRPTVELYHTRRWSVRQTEAGPSLLEAA